MRVVREVVVFLEAADDDRDHGGNGKADHEAAHGLLHLYDIGGREETGGQDEHDEARVDDDGEARGGLLDEIEPYKGGRPEGERRDEAFPRPPEGAHGGQDPGEGDP